MNYNREEILSLRLRASSGLRRLSRREFMSRLQLLQTLEPVVEDAYKNVLKRRWRDQSHDSPHGHPWHVSFHASQFPGDDPMACPRQAMYRMMDLPSAEPPPRRLHLTAITGKAVEVDLVTIMHEDGILISAPPEAEVQTGFEIPELRLTGSVDSAIALKRRAVPVEIKTKHESVIAAMRRGAKGPDHSHVNQLKTQMGLIRNAQDAGELWSDLRECSYGYIYYLPRDAEYSPWQSVQTAEFFVEYDPTWFETGLKVLADWMEMWEDEILFTSPKASKRHPMGWRWSYPPCQFCSYKKVCQADHKDGIETLGASNGIEMAKEVRPEYSYAGARERVDKRWDEDEREAA